MLEFPYKRLRLINYFIILCILVSALLATRNLINISLSKKRLQTNLQENTAVKSSTQSRKDFMSYSPILSKNPFGSPMKFHQINVKQASGDVKQGPPSNLLLVGTVVGPDKLSYAIFEDKSRRTPLGQEVVHHGEEVFNYGTLSNIETSHVELKHDSETFTIPIIEKKHATKSRRRNVSASNSSLARKVGEREYLLNRTKVQHALDNPEQLLTDARLLPNLKGNKQEGFKMFEVKRGGIYDSLGLRNGDILLRVNELEISNPEVAINAMTAIKGMDKVSLDIIRNGEKISMDYEIR